MIKQKMVVCGYCSVVFLLTLILIAPLSAAEVESGKSSESAGKALVEMKCTICHSVERVYGADKTHLEWGQTVEKMMRYSDQMDFLNQQEQENIIEYLSNWKNAQSKSEK